MSLSQKNINYQKHINTYLQGKEGEDIISSMLRNRGIRFIDNVYLKIGGETTQIDKIIITPKGVSILEIKNLQNSIVTGDLSRRYWSVSYYGKTHRVYSPFMQNLSHICKLKSYIRNSDLYLYNFVLYSDNVKLNIQKDNGNILNGEYRCVNHYSDLDYICNYGSFNFSPQTMDLLEVEFRKLKKCTDKYATEHLRRMLLRYGC